MLDARNEDMLRVGRRSAAPDEGPLRVLPGGLSETPPPPPPPTLVDVGAILRKARKRKDLTLESVANDTRIPRRALAAFEDGSGGDALPEPPYDRYFLREYARYLGLDDQPLLEALGDRHRDAEFPLDLLPVATRPRRWPVWTLGVASAALLATLGLTRLSSGPASPTLPRPNAPAVTQVPRAQVPVTAPAGSPTRGISAVIRVSDRCWVQAIVDGRTVTGQTYDPGKVLRFHAKKTLHLDLGNAGGVGLTVNGKAIRTGRQGEPIHLTFSWTHGRLVTG